MDSQHIDRHHPVRKNAGGVSEKIIVIVVGLVVIDNKYLYSDMNIFLPMLSLILSQKTAIYLTY